ncbi:MAG: DUF4169 family protein [Sneathiella sp.]|nr:DUF4169 family protein [Sneathiella sp.]
MGDIVNLNKLRKKNTLLKSKAQAKENRVHFGLTKAQKNTNRLLLEKNQKNHSGKKRVKADLREVPPENNN